MGKLSAWRLLTFRRFVHSESPAQILPLESPNMFLRYNFCIVYRILS
jgi:hypothetical protein